MDRGRGLLWLVEMGWRAGMLLEVFLFFVWAGVGKGGF